jgi:hypothetical protein
MTAGEQAFGYDTATAIQPVCSDRTHEPRPLSTEPARRPGEGHTLLDVPLILAMRAAWVLQRHGMALGLHFDTGHLLAVNAPSQREPTQ